MMHVSHVRLFVSPPAAAWVRALGLMRLARGGRGEGCLPSVAMTQSPWQPAASSSSRQAAATLLRLLCIDWIPPRNSLLILLLLGSIGRWKNSACSSGDHSKSRLNITIFYLKLGNYKKTTI